MNYITPYDLSIDITLIAKFIWIVHSTSETYIENFLCTYAGMQVLHNDKMRKIFNAVTSVNFIFRLVEWCIIFQKLSLSWNKF